jgi:hypothetical protein
MDTEFYLRAFGSGQGETMESLEVQASGISQTLRPTIFYSFMVKPKCMKR